VSRAARHVLVLGASGVVGWAATDRFLRDESFDVTAVSRRTPAIPALPEREGYAHVPIDLRDADAVAAAVRGAGAVTEVVYAALFEKSDLIAGWVDQEQIDTNRRMFANVLDALRAARAPVEHFSILQGTKAYGYHVAPMRIPGRESQPRVGHGNFYWEQEDLLVAAGREMGFAYTIFRPQFIFGGVLGVAMNLVPVIGVYAALCRELGRPFVFPGGASYVGEAVDSRLLGDALYWASDAPAARNETFNITNGDVFEWRDLWGSFARELNVATGPDERMSLAAWLPEQEAAWGRIVERHDLRRLALADVLGLSHQYADDAFSYTPDGSPLESRSRPVLLSTVKLRQAGFGKCIDTEQMFAYWFARLRSERILP
jgi:nucleoside-diphosphate-sugar epimerase